MTWYWLLSSLPPPLKPPQHLLAPTLPLPSGRTWALAGTANTMVPAFGLHILNPVFPQVALFSASFTTPLKEPRQLLWISAMPC